MTTNRLALAVLACVALAAPSAATAQAPIPLSPVNGHVFAWEEVKDSGVQLIVQAQPGLFGVQADVSRDPGLVSFADYVTLYEVSPGRYEGTALEYIYDAERDPGGYYWQAYYSGPPDPNTFESERIAGPVHSFSIKVPYRAPSLSLIVRQRLFAGTRYGVRLRYAPGSEPYVDRLNLLTTPRARCPSRPDPGAGRSLISDAGPLQAA